LLYDLELINKLKWRINFRVFADFNINTNNSKVEDYQQIAAKYCSRELTNIKNALDAFAGISYNFWKK